MVFVLMTGLASAASRDGKAAGKKPIAFSGRVESVDLKLQTVAVRHGAIPGFMPAMTMDYPVDNAALLKQMKPDDEITATVYVGDPTLHDVHLLSRDSDSQRR